MDKLKNLQVKCNSKNYIISVKNNATVKELKNEISRVTGISLNHDILKNLKIKGCKPKSCTKLSDINVKAGTVITLTEDTINVPSTSRPCRTKPILPAKKADIKRAEVRRVELQKVEMLQRDIEKVQLAIERSKRFCNKIDLHACQCTLKVLATPRANKKLLVLDLDQTLVDIKKFGVFTVRTKRPYLNTFLTQVYRYYDLVIWSATDLEILEEKLNMVSLNRTANFKFMALADRNAMMTIFLPEFGMLPLKPLGVLWNKYRIYNKTNSIMIDDLYSNMALNPLNGLIITPYEEKNYAVDTELLRLMKYLINLAKFAKDFTAVNHQLWETYNPL